MNSRIGKLLLASTLSAGAVGAAHAEGFYVGGNVGHAEWQDSIGGIQGDSNGLSSKLYGGYQFTPYLGLEAGAMDLGHVSGSAGTAKAYGAYLDGVGTLPLAPQWSLLGRVGVAHASLDTSVGDATSTGLKLGAGVQYDITPRLALRGEYERYRFDSVFDSKPNVDQFTVGLKLGF